MRAYSWTNFWFGISHSGCREKFYLQALCSLCLWRVLQDDISLPSWNRFRLTSHSQQLIFNLLSRSSASETLQSVHLLLFPILGSWVCFGASSVWLSLPSFSLREIPKTGSLCHHHPSRTATKKSAAQSCSSSHSSGKKGQYRLSEKTDTLQSCICSVATWEWNYKSMVYCFANLPS